MATATTEATETTEGTAVTILITTNRMEDTGYTMDMEIIMENTKVRTVGFITSKQQNCRTGKHVPCIINNWTLGKSSCQKLILCDFMVSSFAYVILQCRQNDAERIWQNQKVLSGLFKIPLALCYNEL